MVVYVYQTDNRPDLDYLKKTMEVNKYYSKMNDYVYIFEEMKVEGDFPTNTDYLEGKFPPALYKIMMVNKFLSTNTFEENDILIFLDSDAWIFNPVMLEKLLNSFPLSKQGIFSRDPYVKKNTYINSGSFIIRINEYTKNMYSFLEKKTRERPRLGWPWDQVAISDYIFENKEDFIIYEPDILNTPIGLVLRHHWIKKFQTCKCEEQSLHETFDLTEYIDKEPFPNTIENGEGFPYFGFPKPNPEEMKKYRHPKS